MSGASTELGDENMSRCIKIDNWIFELKMVRAIRAEEYGQPYSAIANINFNGNSVYVDGLMTNSTVELVKEDFNTLKTYFQGLGVKEIKFDRYKNQQAMARSFDVPAKSQKSTSQPLQLVTVG
jgi:hypothetical protein